MNGDQLTSLIRSLLKFGGGMIVARGWSDSATWEAVAGGVVALAGILWSHWNHSETPTTNPTP